MTYSQLLFFSMVIYQCENCGCVEESTRGNLHTWHLPEMYSWANIEYRRGMKLCSACSPIYYADGKRNVIITGRWHDAFERIYLPLGMFTTGADGSLVHKETGDKNYMHYRVFP